MKNYKMRFLGLAALALLAGLVMTACGNGDYTGADATGLYAATLKYPDYTFTVNGKLFDSGTYKVNGNVYTFVSAGSVAGGPVKGSVTIGTLNGKKLALQGLPELSKNASGEVVFVVE